MNGLTGKVAVVTGAAQGIGYAIAKRLAEEKVAGLAVLDWDRDGIMRAAEELNALGTVKVMGFQCDVASSEAVEAVIAQINNAFGQVDILVNNAGIIRDGMFHKMTFDQWDSVLKVNLYGVFNCCRAVIQGMRDRGCGRIVNLSSTSAYGSAGQTNYAASKAAIIGFTKSLAKEGARKGITVNAVAPDFVNTKMMNSVPEDILRSVMERVPMQRMGEPEEVAALVAFLCSADASYVSGCCIDCSGAERT